MNELAETLGSVRRGLIPAHLYHDAETHELERDRLFSRAWVFLGHESELPEPNDYIVRNILDDSFLVTRDAAGEIICIVLDDPGADRNLGRAALERHVLADLR